MNDKRERVDRLACKQDIELHELRSLVFIEVVVQRRIALRAALELVEVVHDQLRERNLPKHLDRGGRKVIHRDEVPPSCHGKVHDRTHIIRWNEDLRFKVGFFDMIDLGSIRHVLRRMKREHLTVTLEHVVFHRRCCREQVEVKLTLETLLDDLHMEQS